MKKLRILFKITFVLIFLFGCSAYIDYFIVKTKNTTPKISIKKEINDNLTVYNALTYRVWYCKINGKYTIGDYKDSDAVCFEKDSYDENGNYTNNENVLIKKEEVELLSVYYTSGQISTMTEEDLKNALSLIMSYGKTKYKKVSTKESTIKATTTTQASASTATSKSTTKVTYDIVIFGEYKLDTNNEYSIVYNDKIQYCMNSENEIALFQNNTCGNIFEKIKFDTKLCSLYKETTIKKDSLINSLCKE